jgi:hypothetical protein
MTKKDFIKEIEELENECLCWFTESDLNGMNVMFKTTESLLNKGVLIYEHNDNLFVGKDTYQKIYGVK